MALPLKKLVPAIPKLPSTVLGAYVPNCIKLPKPLPAAKEPSPAVPAYNNAALPTSEDAIFLTALVAPLTAFLTDLLIPPNIAGSLGTTSMMPPPIRNCLSICPLDIVII